MKDRVRTLFRHLKEFEGKEVEINAWITGKRSSKNILFMNLRDGSGFCQCVVEKTTVGEQHFSKLDALSLESAISAVVKVVPNAKQPEGVELNLVSFSIISETRNYPIANKAHGADFLLDNRHLWLRSKKQWAIMQVRNRCIVAINSFLQAKDFIQTDAPIFTANACEGTTELFKVDYYDSPVYLSQSGQLYGEALALALGRIYTFGPTFRAEKSKTRRHLTEFWMMEPEMSFFDLAQTMDFIEELLKFVINDILSHCSYALTLLERDTAVLQRINAPFLRLTYEEAVAVLHGKKNINGRNALDILEDDIKSTAQEMVKVNTELGVLLGQKHPKAKIDFLKNRLKVLEERAKNLPVWRSSAENFKFGSDFGGSDETILTRLDTVPVMVYNWPHEIKAFYLKRDENDARWAKGVDVLAPEGYGEIIGGGERETNLELLLSKIDEHKLPQEAFKWYTDLRRYGSVTHSGFGLGLERFVAWICKLSHLREAIPFARTYRRIKP